MIRIVRTAKLAALRQAAFDLAAAHEEYKQAAAKELDATSRMADAYRQELGVAVADLERLKAVHKDVRRQARDWETAYTAVADGIGAWVAEVRAKVEAPTGGSEFQGRLALGLWEAYLAKAEESGEDLFTVRLLKALLLGADAQPDTHGETPEDQR